MSTSNLRQSLYNITKWPRKVRKINRTIRTLKNEDKRRWKSDYYSGNVHAVGYKYQNLDKYLKEKRKALTRTYRDRARTRIIEREQEALAVQAANQALIAQIAPRDQRAEQEILERRERDLHRRLFQRRYAPGVEIRLASEGLSSEEIERRSEAGRSVANDLVRRHQRAPIILQEILAEADREHEEMMERIQESPSLEEERDESPRQESDDDFDEDVHSHLDMQAEFDERLRSLSGQGRDRRKTRKKNKRHKKNKSRCATKRRK